MRNWPVLVTPAAALGLALFALPAAEAQALDPFTDGSALLQNPDLSSGVAIGVADMNADGFDDIVRLDQTQILEVEYQNPDGSGFQRVVYGAIPGSAWGLTIGDVDRNGMPDIFAGGAYDGLKLLIADETGLDWDLTFMPTPPGDIFVQCVNFADIDNNGTLDLFVCNDDALSAPFNNDGTGVFTYDTGLIDPAATLPSGVLDPDSGNYGTVWTDYDNDGDQDLYIAKCRLGIDDPLDGSRVNLLFQNDGAGGFTEVAEAAGLRPLRQSWAMDFADIDNDGDMDAFLVNHDATSDLYENLGPGAELGTFADITDASGMVADLDDIDLGIQAHFEDFDNDTFVDLLVTGRSGEHRLFINNGDKTFTAEANPFPTGGIGIQSAAVGDLDADGFPDIVAGFATGFNQPSGNADKVFLNPGNANGWIDIRLTGVESNATAVGARVELHGEWGTQIREVRAGESYGVNNSATRHFGLGSATAIDSIVVRWPSGHVDTAENPPVNVTVHITEGCPDIYYEDVDGDGFGDPNAETTACLLSAGLSADNTDCDDADGNNFPDNPEICDGADNNCDGQVDEGVEDECVGGSSSGGVDGTADGTADAGGTTGVMPPTTDPTADGDGSSTGGPSESGDDGGCGCDVDGPTRGGWLGLVVMGLLAARRRRSGCA